MGKEKVEKREEYTAQNMHDIVGWRFKELGLSSDGKEKKFWRVQTPKRSAINIVVSIAGFLVLLMALNSGIVVSRLNAHIGLALIYVLLVWNFVLLGIAVWRKKQKESE